MSRTTRFWTEKRRAVRELIDSGTIEGFLAWSSITATMFVQPIAYIETERAVLADHWPKLQEPWGFPDSNLVHQSYHLYNWEKLSGRRVSELGRIVEVGGGYGALVRVSRAMGFKGEYVIYDTPEFSRLQRHYLKVTETEAECKDEFSGTDEADLFVGLFSLSELPLDEQKMYLDGICAPHFLFAMNDAEWERVATNKPLIEYAQARDGVRLDIPHIPGRFYLIK